MATQTTNLNLTKPDLTDFYDVNVVNGNADKIDDFASKTVTKDASGNIALSGGG